MLWGGGDGGEGDGGDGWWPTSVSINHPTATPSAAAD